MANVILPWSRPPHHPLDLDLQDDALLIGPSTHIFIHAQIFSSQHIYVFLSRQPFYLLHNSTLNQKSAVGISLISNSHRDPRIPLCILLLDSSQSCIDQNMFPSVSTQVGVTWGEPSRFKDATKAKFFPFNNCTELSSSKDITNQHSLREFQLQQEHIVKIRIFKKL